MRFSTLSLILLAIISSSNLSCTRAKSDNSQIVISVEDFKKTTSTTCTKCLKFLAVNVSGPGIPNTIYANLQHENFSEEGTQLTAGEIVLDVPSGEGRLIEMVAAYAETSAPITVSYGSQVTTISGTSNVVTIPLDSLGEFRGGAIVGRYLTSTNSGPTGNVSIALRPKPNMPRFTLLKTSIANGWFNFFASENFKISYILDDGTEIFSDVSLDENFKETDLVGKTQVARVSRPTTYFEEVSGNWIQVIEEEHSDVVFGFFFANGLSDPNKKVCKEPGPVTLSKLARNAAGSLLDYNPAPTAISDGVNVHGGTTCTLFPHKFTEDTISITSHQFNGEGNDTAQSIHGAFTHKLNGTDMSKYTRTGNTFQFPVLPDLFGNGKLYNEIKIFSITPEPASRDNIRCDNTELSNLGYSELTLTGVAAISTSANSNTISVTTANSIGANQHLVVCPAKDGQMNGFGGQYIGDITPYAFLTFDHGSSYNFGDNLPHTSVTRIMTLTNSGGASAYISYVSNLSTPFMFLGGYPGNGGDCPSYPGTLAANTSCSIAVKFTPTDNTPHNQPLMINYSDAAYGATTLSTSFTGQGM
jgi:hypothetical protein